MDILIVAQQYKLALQAVLEAIHEKAPCRGGPSDCLGPLQTRQNWLLGAVNGMQYALLPLHSPPIHTYRLSIVQREKRGIVRTSSAHLSGRNAGLITRFWQIGVRTSSAHLYRQGNRAGCVQCCGWRKPLIQKTCRCTPVGRGWTGSGRSNTLPAKYMGSESEVLS